MELYSKHHVVMWCKSGAHISLLFSLPFAYFVWTHKLS